MLALYLSMLDSDADRERFLWLYHTYEKRLFAAALSILKTEAQAEDAEQQVWLKVIEQFNRISAVPHDKIGGYLAAMVRNEAFMILRRGQREVPFDDELLHEAVASPSENGGELERLVKAVRSLPERYRCILELRLVEELSTAETAEILNLPVSTVTTRLQRGREILKQKLREEGYVR